jgi:hypothetical protein
MLDPEPERKSLREATLEHMDEMEEEECIFFKPKKQSIEQEKHQ